jgi:hypothetical protein
MDDQRTDIEVLFAGATADLIKLILATGDHIRGIVRQPI